MKKLLTLSVVLALLLWFMFAGFLLGIYQPEWLPSSLIHLSRPKSLADLGQSFSTLEGLISSLALMLGLIAIIIQTKQNADSNIIGAFSARLQYLLSDCERLENQIQSLKSSCRFDQNLFNNMVEKKKRQLDEAKAIDEKIKSLLNNI
ncbi:hypothetical protein [Plesiomonas sp. PI-19]|uniref:hypothetical protein n=1 Tax=Plesiomonas sp. PI-19 TaxID=2898798 RepID=UPI001F3C87C8|nr:hypothetical protein [Plesiomonas sp. PI-19]MCE5163740.1 hypothetical protein [Plesiomonas sp. PI-19]